MQSRKGAKATQRDCEEFLFESLCETFLFFLSGSAFPSVTFAVDVDFLNAA